MQKKLRILFLSNRSLLPIKDGHTRRSYNVLKGLASKCDVHYVSLIESVDEISEINVNQLKGLCSKIDLIPSPRKQLCFSMLLRLVVSVFTTEPYTIWRHYSRKYQKLVNKLIETGVYDLVHCDNLPISYTCRHNRSIFRSITDHDVSYLKCARMAGESKNILIKMLLYYESVKMKYLEKKMLTQFDLTITVSETDKSQLNKLNPNSNMIVIENGVDTSEFVPSNDIQSDGNTLLWVGGLNTIPNECGMHYFLTNIYNNIKERVPNVTLTIIGDNISTRLSRIICFDSTIKYVGYVDNPLPYIQKSTVFIAPILSGSGTKLKLLEAMSVGKAIVTTGVGCEGIEGSDGTHYVVADTQREFTDAIIILLNDAVKRNLLGNNARKLAVEKYDWSVILDKLTNKYMDIL